MMVWIRLAQWDFDFQCCYTGNFMLTRRARYNNLRFIKKYSERPIDDLASWAYTIAQGISEDRASYSCKELVSDFESCDVNIINLRYSEMLV